tara:strand:- start:24 stop:419 length:396 start_codon:yes stop_codon:yes gene_type:complete
MTNTTFKDKRRKYAFNVYTAQKNTWNSALEVSDQIISRVSKRKNIFGENFIDYIQSMRGQINSVQRHEYKMSNHIPQKKILDDLDQFFNRFVNLYLDTEITNDDMVNQVRFEAVEMKRRCQTMVHKYRHPY